MNITFLRQLSGTLYSAVIMELLERLAYYGMYLVLGIYLMDEIGIPADLYGLVVPGIFMSTLYLLPLFAGALADKYGYRPALMVAFSTLTAGYLLLGNVSSFAMICVALGLIAMGGSIIKPVNEIIILPTKHQPLSIKLGTKAGEIAYVIIGYQRN